MSSVVVTKDLPAFRYSVGFIKYVGTVSGPFRYSVGFVKYVGAVSGGVTYNIQVSDRR